MDHATPLRIPAPLRHHVEQLFRFTDPFCGEHLDAEYADLVRKVIAKLARKRPSPLVRGDRRIWAAAAIYAVGSVNFLFDRTPRPHLTAADLSALTGVPKSTIANKARLIRDVLRIKQLDPEFLPAGAARVAPDGVDDGGRRPHRGWAHQAAGGSSGGTDHPRV